MTIRRLTVAVFASALGVAPALPMTVSAEAAVGPGGGSTKVSRSYTPPSSDARIAGLLTSRTTTARFGTSFTGAVIDAATGRVVWSKNGNTGYMPASTRKWLTATNALRVFGNSHGFTTTVKSGGQRDQVILVGSGDRPFPRRS